jgi:hypothetical protein
MLMFQARDRRREGGPQPDLARRGYYDEEMFRRALFLIPKFPERAELSS